MVGGGIGRISHSESLCHHLLVITHNCATLRKITSNYHKLLVTFPVHLELELFHYVYAIPGSSPRYSVASGP